MTDEQLARLLTAVEKIALSLGHRIDNLAFECGRVGDALEELVEIQKSVIEDDTGTGFHGHIRTMEQRR